MHTSSKQTGPSEHFEVVWGQACVLGVIPPDLNRRNVSAKNMRGQIPTPPNVPEALLRDEPCGAIHLTTNKNKKLVFSQWLHYLLHSTTNSYCNFYTWSVSIFEKFLNNYKWVKWFFREEIIRLNSSKSWFTKVKLWFLILHILYFSWNV